jgi:ABC-type enterochelin transport system permease subunit
VWKEFEEKKKIDNTIKKGATFRIVIDILLTGFNITINEMEMLQIKTESTLPPWSAGNLFVSKNGNMVKLLFLRKKSFLIQKMYVFLYTEKELLNFSIFCQIFIIVESVM